MINRRDRKVKNIISTILVDSEESDDFDGLTATKWNIMEKVKSGSHCCRLAKVYDDGKNFSKKNFEKEGFSTPILFIKPDGLGLNVPISDFGVNDVETNVGKDRVLDVVDVNTQDAIGMTMREWCQYYNNPIKERLLNVISLEYSQTKMDDIVRAPDVVLEVDWLESCWPQSCRDISVDNQSHLKSMTYPKVRKYCLMSVNGCYTDFHIDLGGTSVWYHIFKGEKIFWMVPPTEENLKIFVKWSLSANQTSYFFPDLVEKCEKVHLKQGNTFLIPSGWIHGVYTPVDSLVFGGNFLHSFSIETQIRIWDVEERIKVNTKYRYPFFVEMHWYVLATLVSKVNGKCYFKKSVKKDAIKHNLQNQLSSDKPQLNDYEIIGFYIIFQWLSDNAISHSKSVPKKIISTADLLSDAEYIIKSLPLIPSTSQAYKDMTIQTLKLIKFQESSRRTSTTSMGLFHKLSSEVIPQIILLREIPREDSGSKSSSQGLKHSAVHKRRPPHKSKKAKLTCAMFPEIPTDMYHQIVVPRDGGRLIKRPDRLIETTHK